MFNPALWDPTAHTFSRPDFHSRILIGLSIANIFGWIFCTTFQAMILIKFNVPNSQVRFDSMDLISPGIWGSLCYGITGILGICSAYERRQPLLISTLIMATLSVFSSLAIAAVSGVMAISTRFRSQHDRVWQGLEWSLLIFTILSFVVNVLVFVVVAILTCTPCCPPCNEKKSAQCADVHQTNELLPPPPPPPGFNLNPPFHYASFSSPFPSRMETSSFTAQSEGNR